MSLFKDLGFPIAVVGLSVLLVACSSETEDEATLETAQDVADTAETGELAVEEQVEDQSAEAYATTDEAEEEISVAEAETAPAPANPNCAAFPQDLLDKYGTEMQLVLGLAQKKGSTFASMSTSPFGLPSPETFRTMAQGFTSFDPTGIEPMTGFQTPDVITTDLTKTADLLEAALAAGENMEDPAWTALADFYTQSFFVNHNASISHYLGESGCAK